MDEIASLLGRHGYLPHGYCFTWQPGLLWAMVVSDALIALAYFSIPLALWRFALKRRDTSLHGMVTLFGAFIFACGLTHVMDVWTIWQPDYGLQAIGKIVTAVISVGTAILLWKLIPKALTIPSVSQLTAVIASLEAEAAQRRAAENNLADTQEALFITLASIDAGFIATDRQGRVTRVNKTAEAATGWTQAEAQGRSYWEVFVPQERPAGYTDSNPVDVLISQGGSIEQVHHLNLISRTGQKIPIECQASLIRSPQGTERGMAVVFRDMTKLYEAHAESNRLAAIVESSHDAIISKTLDGRITSWNKAAQAIFGYTAAEAIGQPIQMLLPPDRALEEMRILFRISMGQGIPAFDTVRRRKDGSLVEVSVTISPIRDAQGHVIGASKIARDITEQKQAEALRAQGEQLAAENRQIQEASRLKSEFLANMSHELRTPLNAVIGFADLLQTGAVPVGSPKYAAFLGHISTSGRHLLQLINDVLDLSKVEAGKFEFHPEALHLPTLIREVCDILEASASKQQVRIHTELDPEVANLVLDPARLRQVLYNYLSNAIKFTPGGGLVTIRALPQGPDHVRIEVEDTGIGIAAEDLPRLFTEFQQLESVYTKKHAGTGLGLALTRRLVTAQGGHVGVRSTPGQGSVFHLILPRVQVTRQDAHDNHSVLLIHDASQEQAHIRNALRDAGFLVDAATTGEQALACVQQRPYDAITLALRLPGHDGLNVLGQIRRQGLSQSTPVVAMTMPSPPHGTANFQIADVLFKPIETLQVGVALKQIGLGQQAGGRVMVIDDDPTALALMQATLQHLGLESICMDDARQAMQTLDQHQPDAIILDLMMPEFDGFATLDALRRMPRWRHTPVFIWTSMILSDEEFALLAKSAQAILNKGGGTLQALLDDLRRWRPVRHTDKARTDAS